MTGAEYITPDVLPAAKEWWYGRRVAGRRCLALTG